ncbi:MAG: hypothetical protein IPO86_13845 [Saprospiraceae bacterium]|nr:hypothetical protein [Saprospiraceae bacterium]MBK9729186.1 hypothetical protein [Saprospiraceae bacterium]
MAKKEKFRPITASNQAEAAKANIPSKGSIPKFSSKAKDDHLITLDLANSYIRKWTNFNNDLSELLQLISNLNLIFKSPEISELTNRLKSTLLINYERFNIGDKNKFSKNLKKLISKGEFLDIYFGVKPVSDLDEDIIKKLELQGYKETQISCVILLGKDSKENIILI